MGLHADRSPDLVAVIVSIVVEAINKLRGIPANIRAQQGLERAVTVWLQANGYAPGTPELHKLFYRSAPTENLSVVVQNCAVALNTDGCPALQGLSTEQLLLRVREAVRRMDQVGVSEFMAL